MQNEVLNGLRLKGVLINTDIKAINACQTSLSKLKLNRSFLDILK